MTQVLQVSHPATDSPTVLGDPRFRALLTAQQWAELTPAIRQRFSKRLAGGNTVIYRGEVVATYLSRAGWWLAQLARLVGGPLPTARDAGTPAVVTVTEDIATQGQHWTRLYVRHSGFPQVIHSSKRFAGPTGLEEYIGAGLGIALQVEVAQGALIFRSAGYFLQVFGKRLRLPGCLTPGDLTVTHRQTGNGRFSFTLDVRHPRLGVLITQTASFEDIAP